MENDIMANTVTMRDRVRAINDAAELAKVWPAAMNALAFVRETVDMLKERGIEIMKADGLRGVEIDDRIKIILTKKKTDRFETAAIYKALGFTQEQQDVLPKNPSWRKTAILANDKTSAAHWIEEKDDLEIKELDEAMMKKLGHK
jgi:hypothetical protein